MNAHDFEEELFAQAIRRLESLIALDNAFLADNAEIDQVAATGAYAEIRKLKTALDNWFRFYADVHARYRTGDRLTDADAAAREQIVKTLLFAVRSPENARPL